MTMMTSPANTTLRLRPAAALTCAGITLAMLAGCSPQPEPTPTETPLFASEEEAFAAAEETFREYIAASDVPSDEAKPADFLIGHALESHIDAKRALDVAGIHFEGVTQVVSFSPLPDTVRSDMGGLAATVCLDLSKARTVNDDGQDVTPADRPDRVGMRVEMEVVGQSFMIADELDADNATCES
ncbi:hypothetical protein JF531_05250 [Microbacterium esteraromaticum]|uniref:hypothetical protein n=1 Tax=Microbacterium esteraromaticum TaxID=57043 RepID=UPI001A8F32A0|nr:hypothetical protein [Microbacterium esteraromaticum]MBN8423923.1 hypothetical protein [Microbacterium esteraromaticum]